MNVGEKTAYCKVIDTQYNQKSIVLGGIHETLYSCLNEKIFRKPSGVPLAESPPCYEDYDLREEDSEILQKWAITEIPLPDSIESTGNQLAVALRQLLGRSSHPSNFFPNDTPEYRHTQSLCHLFYLNETDKVKYFVKKPESNQTVSSNTRSKKMAKPVQYQAEIIPENTVKKRSADPADTKSPNKKPKWLTNLPDHAATDLTNANPGDTSSSDE
jgi:hypothetical protein